MGFRPNSSGFVSDASDRRTTGRYKSNGTTILIEWIDDGASRTVPASLKDISMNGALAEAGFSPQAGTSMRIGQGGNPAAGNVKATVVRTSRVRRSEPA